VTVRPAIVATIDSPDAGHDAEAELKADEVAALEAISNLHEFAYEEWMTEVPQGGVGEWVDGKREGDGPPVELFVARTFLDVTTGLIIRINGAEQYRVPYVQVPDAVACAPIALPRRIRLRVVHYYDSNTWGPVGRRTIHQMDQEDDETVRDVAGAAVWH
jgi:hypothetical protein